MAWTRPEVGIKFAERDIRTGQSSERSFIPSDTRLTRRLNVLWAKRFDAAVAILGGCRVKYQAGNPSKIERLERLAPLVDPDPEAAENVRAHSIDRIVGFNPQKTLPTTQSDGSKTIPYKWAQLDVTYRVMRYNSFATDDQTPATQEHTRFVEYLGSEPGSGYISMPGAQLKYMKQNPSDPGPDNGKPVPFGAGIVEPTQIFKFRWVNIPAAVADPTSGSGWLRRVFGDPNNSNLKPLIGTVNKTTVFSYPAGTLLLETVRPIPVTDAFGNPSFDVEVSWNYRPQGWNKLYNFDNTAAKTGYFYVSRSSVYYPPGSVPDGDSLYAERNHVGVGGVFDVVDP